MTITKYPALGGESPARARKDDSPWLLGTGGAALIGVVAVGLAIGVAELVVAVGTWFGGFGITASPLTALGSTFIELTPGWLKEFAISTFGTHDKDALRVGMALTLAVVAAVIGLIGRRRPRWATAVFLLLVVVVAVAVLTRPGSTPADLIPTLLGGAAGLALLVVALRRALLIEPGAEAWVTDRTASTRDEPESFRGPSGGPLVAALEQPGVSDDNGPLAKLGTSGSEHPMALAATRAVTSTVNRRNFFRLAGIGALAAAAAGLISRWIPSTAAVTASRAAVSLDAGTVDRQVVADVDLRVPGLAPFRTPDANFYRVDTAFTVPRVTADEWRLKIHGLVANPVQIDFAQLTAMPQVERMITLCCVSNEVGGNLVGNASWQGVRIADLLKAAGPTENADCVLSTSADGFTVTTPLQALTDDRDALLAVGMNGQPLPLEHGFPVRMVVPGLYGYVSATKWVVDLEVTKFSEVSAFWTERGWAPQGPVKTQSRIDVPSGDSVVKAGTVAIAGVAWAQHRGINAVQVKVDDGPWQSAKLSAPVSIDTWRQWVYKWDATPGQHSIRCRATDGTGAVQTDRLAPVLPDGATGYDEKFVTVTA